MFQQILALIIIFFFISRLFWQKRKGLITPNEYGFWLIFWILAALAVSTLKQLDALVMKLGFSATGIDVLLYIAVLMLFYFIFKMRLRLEKMNKDITKLVRKISIDEIDNDKKNESS